MNDNIFLIGFMGSGKSTVGHLIAKKLGYKFADTDAIVEKVCNISIKDMFEKYGEEYFREREYEALKEVIQGKKQIISTGGGIVTYQKSRELMYGQEVYYIHVEPEVIYKRLKSDTTRPLLKDISVEKITDILSKRINLYEGTCVKKLDGDKAPQKVAEEIIFNILSSEETIGNTEL